ncbi:MAG: hypothetical protein AB4040_00015 [Synechococcus sp.]
MELMKLDNLSLVEAMDEEMAEKIIGGEDIPTQTVSVTFPTQTVSAPGPFLGGLTFCFGADEFGRCQLFLGTEEQCESVNPCTFSVSL